MGAAGSHGGARIGVVRDTDALPAGRGSSARSMSASSPASTGLVLWDVDGTLVRTAGLGTLAFFDAFASVLGQRPSSDIGIQMSGKTDPQIALEMLYRLEVADPLSVLPEVLVALESSVAGLAERMATEGWVLPGVASVMARLAGAGGLDASRTVTQTLLTGNLRPNARAKLGALGLGDGIEYEIGAYGSDASDRCELVPIALQRLAASGRVLDTDRCWVVGDTPRDLQCARAGGVRCLLVATGDASVEELAALEPDAVLADLSDVELVVDLLGGR
jgi:phosphoglycolate phosphatase